MKGDSTYDGAFARGDTAFTREWNAAFGSWAELHQPFDARRACQGPKVVSTARLDRVYVDSPPAVLMDLVVTGAAIGAPTNLSLIHI
eukprot:1266308-Pyramimonas_sp.AAC.1